MQSNYPGQSLFINLLRCLCLCHKLTYPVGFVNICNFPNAHYACGSC